MDTGFSLSKQWSMYHGMWKENFDAIAGTNLIGGLWLLIPGEPLLLWARLGFVILQTLITFVMFKIMLLYFNPKQVLIAALPLSLFLAIWHFYYTINYDNLPFLFFAVSIYTLLKGLKSVEFKKKYFIIAGVIAVLAAFCKITYFVGMLLPLFLIILDRGLSNKNYFKKKILYYFTGLFVGIVIFVSLIFFCGALESYLMYFNDIISDFLSVKDLSKGHSQDHTISGLFLLYKSELLSVFTAIIKFAFYIFLIDYFRIKAGRIKVIKFTVILIGAFILYNFTLNFSEKNQYTNSNLINILSLFLSIYVLWAIISEVSIIRKYIVLVAASLGLFILSFIGSDLGFRAAFHIGSGLVLFSTALILIKESEFKIFNVKLRFSFIYYFVLIVFSLCMINKKDYLYREPDFKYISKAFETPSLFGIKSNPQRVEVVDSLLVYLNTIPEIKNKKIMFTHSNALMYYLTGSNYLLQSPWDILTDYYSLEQSLNLIKPDMFVMPKISHRTPSWPLISPPDALEKRAKSNYDFYDSFIKENNYVEVYKNSFYTVYSLEDKGLQDEQSTE
jgi:hypothetical protein